MGPATTRPAAAPGERRLNNFLAVIETTKTYGSGLAASLGLAVVPLPLVLHDDCGMVDPALMLPRWSAS